MSGVLKDGFWRDNERRREQAGEITCLTAELASEQEKVENLKSKLASERAARTEALRELDAEQAHPAPAAEPGGGEVEQLKAELAAERERREAAEIDRESAYRRWTAVAIDWKARAEAAERRTDALAVALLKAPLARPAPPESIRIDAPLVERLAGCLDWLGEDGYASDGEPRRSIREAIEALRGEPPRPAPAVDREALGRIAYEASRADLGYESHWDRDTFAPEDREHYCRIADAVAVASQPPRAAAAERREELGRIAWEERRRGTTDGSWDEIDPGNRECWCCIADAVVASIEIPRPAAIVVDFEGDGCPVAHLFEDQSDAIGFRDSGIGLRRLIQGAWIIWNPASGPGATPQQEAAPTGRRAGRQTATP